ncbi:MAG: 4Fe-4S dicluster domain-containing protein [Elusimicrobia bacterium]|nr:4Fe-4S dicluster domain-containing protein [Elusimicrobiota bacterium]MBU2614841.1 4Fe-4S dicluster domain-containing protein [Elusimicrobiota bacterium]
MKLAVFLPEIIKNFFKKPNTVRYPFEKLVPPKDFRGTPVFNSSTCIGCKICMMNCPAEAIEIIRVSETEKKFKMILHNDRCIHCAQCAEDCNKDSIKLNEEYELAAFDRNKLKIEYL